MFTLYVRILTNLNAKNLVLYLTKPYKNCYSKNLVTYRYGLLLFNCKLNYDNYTPPVYLNNYKFLNRFNYFEQFRHYQSFDINFYTSNTQLQRVTLYKLPNLYDSMFGLFVDRNKLMRPYGLLPRNSFSIDKTITFKSIQQCDLDQSSIFKKSAFLKLFDGVLIYEQALPPVVTQTLNLSKWHIHKHKLLHNNISNHQLRYNYYGDYFSQHLEFMLRLRYLKKINFLTFQQPKLKIKVRDYPIYATPMSNLLLDQTVRNFYFYYLNYPIKNVFRPYKFDQDLNIFKLFIVEQSSYRNLSLTYIDVL